MLDADGLQGKCPYSQKHSGEKRFLHNDGSKSVLYKIIGLSSYDPTEYRVDQAAS